MLLSHVVTSKSDAKNYFAASLSPAAATARHDYYAEGQESPGVYGGKLAEALGIAGLTADAESFGRLCDNLHPLTAKKLKPRNNEFSRICYDFTISGPKSFSIAEALAPDEEERQKLRQAFAESVEELVSGHMEPDMQCRERRGGADHDMTTGNMLTVAFPHATARPESDGAIPDPHWHLHLLIWNMTQRADGKILAGQFGRLVRDKPYYRAVFYSLLADKLEKLGYVIDRRGGTDWEIAGLPQPMIDKLSKRTAQIEAVAERRGITDEARKAELGAETRGKKQKEWTLPELRREWLAQLTDDERDALARVYGREVAEGVEVTPAAAVDYALRHCSEKLSVIPEREFKRVALLFGLGQVTPDSLDREMQEARHGLVFDTIDGERVVTTQALRAEERAMADYAARGIGSVIPAGLADGLSRELSGGKRLSNEQYQAVTDLLASPNRINLVQGPAGAGKSSLLAKYDEGMRRAGQSVTWLGTTGAAVDVLHKDGFDAHTVAHFLLSDKMQQAARGGRVVVDETSLLGHKEALKLLAVGHKLNLKFVFVGDPMQHGSVGRGAFMRLLEEKGQVRPIRLKRILRQKDPAYRAAAQLLSEGRIAEGFDALDRIGWVDELPDAERRHAAIAADYAQARTGGMAWNDVLVVCPTHAEAKSVTREIRSRLREAGRITGDEREFTRLAAVDASEAERGQATTYHAGDVIQFHQNAHGFKKGERLVIADPAQVPLAEAGKFSLYRREKIGLAVGDVIRFTGTVRAKDGEHTLRNGTARVVAGFTKAGHIRLDNGWVVDKDAGHFRHGFVETSIGSQGRTVRRVLVGLSAESGRAVNMQLLYVAATRAWESLRIVCDDQDGVREAAQRDSRQLLALDLQPQRQEPEPMQEHLERERRLILLKEPFRYPACPDAGHKPPPTPSHTPSGPSHAARVRASQQEQARRARL